MGLTLEEATGPQAKTTFPHFHPVDAERIDASWRASLASGQPLSAEVRVRRADGQYRWHTSHRIPLRDENGNIVRWYSVGIDIEDQKRAEEALREAERNARQIVDTIPGLVATLTPNGDLEFVNRQICEYNGKTADDLISKRWRIRDGIHPDDRRRATELFKQSISSGEPFEFEMRGRRHDGVYRWFQSRGLPLRGANGRIVRWYNLIIDIDERKRAEGKAIEAERELQRLIDNIPVQVSTFGIDGSYQYVNKRSFEDSGLSGKDLRGDHWRRVYHPDDVAAIEREWNASLASGGLFELEIRRRMADATYRWHLIRRVPVHDEKGNVTHWYGGASTSKIASAPRRRRSRPSVNCRD